MKSVRSIKPQTADKELRGHTFLVNRHSVTVEGKIAEGGFAIVYLVRCQRTRRLLALKRQFVNDNRQLEACRREIQIVATLDHKNVVRYVDSSITACSDCVYEYLLLTKHYGANVLQAMNERLAQGTFFRETEVLRIFCDIVEAVARLHQCQTPMIHRDLKIENILIDDNGTYVLCDFGSATNIVFSTITHPITVVEEEITRYTTLSYRAPEMVNFYDGKPITTKSDIWALGVLLYKLCFFCLPFGESNLAIQKGTFSYPDDQKYSTALLSLIRFMLEPNIDLRPDIFQVAVVAFQLLGTAMCPIPNLLNVKPPLLCDLMENYTAMNEQHKKPAANLQSQAVSGSSAAIPVLSTSVQPRQRPKGSAPTTSFPLSTESGTTPWKPPRKTEVTRTKILESVSNPDFVSQLRNVDVVYPHQPDDWSGTFPRSGVLGLSSTAGDISNPLSTVNRRPLPVTDRLPDDSSTDAPVASSSHRRNFSDTSLVQIGPSERLSAFKPYLPSTPQPAQNRCQEGDLSRLGQTQSASASPHPSLVREAQCLSVSNPEFPPVLMKVYKDDNNISILINQDPIRNRRDMDDVSFGRSFDRLPRRNSTSSTKNVKSRESLVMDEADPFGAAPFRIQSDLTHKAKKQRFWRTHVRSVTLSPIGYIRFEAKHSDVLESHCDQSHNFKSRTNFSPTLNAVNPTALVGVAAYSLKVPRSCRYQKLVEETNSDLLLTVPSKFGDQPKSDETDSVGSASDLQARMLSAVTSDDDEDGDSTSRSDFGDVRPPSECVKHADCPKWTAPLLSSFCGYQPFEPDDRPTDGQLSHSELLELPKSIASLSTPDAIIELLGHQPLLEDSDNEVDSGDYSHSTLASDGGAVLGLPSDFGPSQTFRQFDFSGVGVGGMRHCEDIFLNAPLKQTCLQNDFAATDVSPLSHNQAYSPSRSSCRAMKTIRAKRLLVSRLSADANRSSGESNRCDSLPCVTPKVDCSDWPVEKVADHLQVICMSHENVTTELSVMESSTVASDSSTTTTDEETNFGGGSNRRNCRSEPLGKMSQSVRFRSRNVGGGRSSRRLDSGGEISGFIPTKKKTFNHRRSELASNDSAFINSSFQNEVEDQLVMVDTKKSS